MKKLENVEGRKQEYKIMSKTENLLLQIKQALVNGALPVSQVPIEDIKVCVIKELESNVNTFTDSQYQRVLQYCFKLFDDMPDYETDADKLILFLDGALLCVSMISEAIRGLANADHWRERHREEAEVPEVAEIIEYIGRKGTLDVFNYDFAEKYNDLEVEIMLDESAGMYYIPYRGRKMYFPAKMGEEEILEYHRTIACEQDAASPHYYYKEGYYVREGDVVVDAGVAEGNFSLNIIDKAKEIYLIEADEDWAAALALTFADDADKVHIIRAYLDKKTEGESICLNDLFVDKEVNFIKMDIEGFERDALGGADRALARSADIRCAVCSYHNKGDERWIANYLQEYGFETTVSRGYMCPAWSVEAYLDAELRRGIVFGRKNGKDSEDPVY